MHGANMKSGIHSYCRCCVASVCDLLHVTFLAPRIWMCLLDFWKNFLLVPRAPFTDWSLLWKHSVVAMNWCLVCCNLPFVNRVIYLSIISDRRWHRIYRNEVLQDYWEMESEVQTLNLPLPRKTLIGYSVFDPRIPHVLICGGHPSFFFYVAGLAKDGGLHHWQAWKTHLVTSCIWHSN